MCVCERERERLSIKKQGVYSSHKETKNRVLSRKRLFGCHYHKELLWLE